MTMLQEWMQGLTDWVLSLFGAQGGFELSEHPLVFWLLSLGLLLVPAGMALLVLLRGYRAVSRGVQRLRGGFARDLHLLYSRDGRRGLALAREIRRGSRRLRGLLLDGEEAAGENRALLRLLDKFIGKDLPDTLAQAQTFIATGGAALSRKLESRLARQEARWAEAGDAAAREALQQEIAATRQQLAQTRHSNEARAQLLKGLEEAVLALRTLELEMASLGATRSQALAELREQLTDMAEGLHHQRQVHLSFQDNQ